MVRNLKNLVVVGALALGGLLAAGSARAQYLPPNGNPGPFPPRTGGWYGTYPYGPWGWNYGGWNYRRGFGYGGFPGTRPAATVAMMAAATTAIMTITAATAAGTAAAGERRVVPARTKSGESLLQPRGCCVWRCTPCRSGTGRGPRVHCHDRNRT